MKFPHLVIAVVAAAGGWMAAVSFQGHPGAGVAHAADGMPAARPSQCPMHPWVMSEQPGQCTVCGMNLVAAHDGRTGFGHAARGIVLLQPGSVNAIGVQTAEVRKQPLARTLRVAGMIGEDESRHGIITAPVEGRIDGLAMSCEGEKMTHRQPLLTMFSRALLAAADDYKVALTQEPADVEKAKNRLLQMGLVHEQIASIPTRQADHIHFGILAPLSGTIVKTYVAEGQYVREGEKLFEIADFRKVWFMFTAYEADLPFIQVGQVVEITAPSSPGPATKARVAFISPNLDDMTRSARVRVVLENPDGRFKNKTFAQGVVMIDAPEVLAIPRSAVLAPGDTPRVYVEKASGVYQQRPVSLGRAGDACWEVLEGVQEGERVVLAGNMLIDAQAQLDAMTMGQDSRPRRMTNEFWCGVAANAKRVQLSAQPRQPMK